MGWGAAARGDPPALTPLPLRGRVDRHGRAIVSPWPSGPEPDNNVLGVWKRGGVGNGERRKSYEQKKKIIRKSNKKI